MASVSTTTTTTTDTAQINKSVNSIRICFFFS